MSDPAGDPSKDAPSSGSAGAGGGRKMGGSLKDRIAMFNQPKAASPPPKPSKPKAFKWKTSDESARESTGNDKIASVSEPPPTAPTPTPSGPGGSTSSEGQGTERAESGAGGANALKPTTSASSTEALRPSISRSSASSAGNEGEQGTGLSAADAKQKAGSLKDRIALLSGLKVDQPGMPGRPPKPLKKKPEGDDSQAAAASQGAVAGESGSKAETVEQGDIKIDTAKAQSIAPGTDTPGEPVASREASFQAPAPASPTDDLASAADASTPADRPASGGVALPAMPTRARGPQRKGKSGASATSASAGVSTASPVPSPASERPPQPNTEVMQTLEERGPTIEAPVESINYSPDVQTKQHGIEAIASPSKESRAFVNEPEQLATMGKGVAGPGAEVLAAEDDEEQADLELPKRGTLVSPSSSGIPLPPPTAAMTGDNEDEGEEDDAEDEQGEVQKEMLKAEKALARQTLDDKPEHERVPRQSPTHSEDAPMLPAPTPSTAMSSPSVQPKSLPTVPFPVDPSIATPASEGSQPKDSPVSPRLVNRRSMTRPPVPGGYSRPPSFSASTSARSSLDVAPRRSQSIREENTEPHLVSAEPDDTAGDWEFANPALDSEAIRLPIQPPVGQAFDTDIVSNPTPEHDREKKRASLARHNSSSTTRGGPPSRQGSMGPGRPLPNPSASTMDVASQGGNAGGEPETNIQAASASRSEMQQEPEHEEAAEEEYQDPEVARRQALAKRMAAMGGMKLGMLPPMFGGGQKKKPTQPSEDAPTSPTPKSPAPESTPTSPFKEQPPSQMPLRSPSVREEPTSPGGSRSSRMPPPGAFVLPGFGSPAQPPPPPPPVPSQEEDEVEEAEREEEEQEIEEEEDADQEDVMPEADETITDDDHLVSRAPPPLPGNRPSRLPPPVATSFIDDDTDTDGAESKRTSLQSSVGLSSASDFPAPPGQSERQRTQSSRSMLSEGPIAVAEEPEELDYDEEGPAEGEEAEDEDGDGIPPPLPPSRPSRPAPQVSTTQLSGSTTTSGSEQIPASPASQRSASQRSVPGTPISVHGRQSSSSQNPMSPTDSSGSRRSSTQVPPAAGGGIPASQSQQSIGGGGPPSLSHDYLSYLAKSALRTKSREVDGPLGAIMNDIAYAHRADPNIFGTSVWRMYVSGEKGVPGDLQIHGRIEAGCVVVAWDAKFDRGLGRSSLKIGSAQVPHFAIVAEDVKDVKKPKLRVIELVQGRHSEATYNLDNLKQGMVDLRRLP